MQRAPQLQREVAPRLLRSLPGVATDTRMKREWTAEQKAQFITEASALGGEELKYFLGRQAVPLAPFAR
jgi:hypothetical protein